MTDDTLWRYVHMYSIRFCWCFNWTSNSAKQMFDSYLLRTFEKMVSKLFRNWKVRVVPFACRFSIGLVAKRASGGGESAGEAEKGEDAEVCVVSYQYPFEVRAVLQERFFGHLICLKDMPHISSSYEIDVFLNDFFIVQFVVSNFKIHKKKTNMKTTWTLRLNISGWRWWRRGKRWGGRSTGCHEESREVWS